MYKLEFLPIAQQDMVEIVQYISNELRNPTAVVELLAEELISAADSIRTFPYANSQYIPLRTLAHEYRKLLIQNYLMFYWVDEKKKLITVARVIYAQRNCHLLFA